MTNFGGQFSFPDNYFEIGGKDKATQFDRDCTKILDSFKLKFLAGGRGDRQKYLSTFFIARWHELSVAERKEHSLSNCIRCFEKYYDCQHSFPLKPMFTHKPPVVVDQDALQRQGIKKFTCNVLTELNWAYELETSTSFSDAVAATRSSCLQKKLTPEEKRKETTQLKKKFTKSVNAQFAEKATISMLAECESKRKYHRKRLLQSLFTNNSTSCKKEKSFSRVLQCQLGYRKVKDNPRKLASWHNNQLECNGKRAWDPWEKCQTGCQGICYEVRNRHCTHCHTQEKDQLKT